MSLTRVALVVAHDGTAFAGWQSQDGLRTVQDEIERALATLCGAERESSRGGERIVVEGSGRTDAGVHAIGQVAHADLPRVPSNLRYRINALLPEDLRILGATAIDASFHARKSATGKRYAYSFDCGEVAAPLHARYRWHVGSRLDRGTMARAARRFEGERDFASLQSTGSSVATTIRAITRCEIEERGDEVRLVVDGSGFLRHMVRAIAGCLLEVGRGRHPPEWIDDVLAARDRAAAGPNAPAHGLVLEAVQYPEPFESLLAEALRAKDERSRKDDP